jgi:hypothetical protein
VLQELLDYALGRRPRAVAMQALGTQDYGVLLRMLNAAGLPQPLVARAQREPMAKALADVLREAQQPG